MAYDARAIANRFLDLARNEGESLSQMKLQKLVYFAHGYYLAFTELPLIEDPVEAWKFGPVIRSLYREFARFGSDEITEPATVFDGTSLEERKIKIEDYPDFATNEYVDGLISEVWRVYKDLSAVQLSNLTHQEGTPWAETWDGETRYLKIPTNRIRDHFVELTGAHE